MPRIIMPIYLLFSLSLVAATESHPEQELPNDPSNGSILLEDFDSSGLLWEPLLDFEQANLTIAGKQGLVWEWRFDQGDILGYDLLDSEGVPLPDGSYTYEWRVTVFQPDSEETLAVKVQSGRFQIQEGMAVSLARAAPEGTFPMTTNPEGNHFMGDITVQYGLCTGCEDGESAVVTDNSGFSVVDIRAKGLGIAFEEDFPTKEIWSIYSSYGDLKFRHHSTGSETGLYTHPLVIGDEAPHNSLYVASSGKIGMGTSTPTASLHIARSDGKARLLVKETAASTEVRTLFELKNNGAPRFALKNTNSQIEWSFQQSSAGNFLISHEGTGGPELQVYQGGRVRMGPGGTKNFDLDPSGNLQIKGTLTAGADGITFPDYVFEPGYDLMSLSDLRTYIEQEKRLPDIPSAEEVEQQGGHNMTELQLKLLEKIEELTLYTLEQQEMLQEQGEELLRKDAELASQGARIKHLEARLASIEALMHSPE